MTALATPTSGFAPAVTDDRVWVELEVERIKELLCDAADSPRPQHGRLAAVSDAFSLSDHERDVLALVVAVELDGGVAELVAGMTGGDPRPTPALAMAVLTAAHWDAFGQSSPLRWWHLVDLAGTGPLMQRAMAVDERVLHHIVGMPALDARLAGVAATELDASSSVDLSSRQGELAAELAATLASLHAPAAVVLDGDDARGRMAVARQMSVCLGLAPLVVRSAALPPPGPELALAARLIDREVVLSGAVPIVDRESGDEVLVAELLAQLRAPIVVQVGGSGVAFEGRIELGRTVELPSPADLREVLTAALGAELTADPEMRVAVDAVAQSHRMDAATAWSIARELAASPDGSGAPADTFAALCRRRTVSTLDGIARRVEPVATWSDLVLPEAQMRLLAEVASHAQHRHTVHETWGFGGPSSRGLGLTVLFTGDSGTGKTLAAEVLAGQLGTSLLVVDLSQVVSKWVGETEKHLAKLFEAAERSGAVLLFDEGEVLFGKRTDVRSSNDRYGNLEVAYLLARMESYRGLAILTTNLKANVDRAFIRRLRFVVNFPFPDEATRARIWECVLPPAAPTDGLDPAVLARLNLSGGSIRSVALSAAFAAAEAGSAITPSHVLRAAEVESAKVDRSLTGTERGALS